MQLSMIYGAWFGVFTSSFCKCKYCIYSDFTTLEHLNMFQDFSSFFFFFLSNCDIFKFSLKFLNIIFSLIVLLLNILYIVKH